MESEDAEQLGEKAPKSRTSYFLRPRSREVRSVLMTDEDEARTAFSAASSPEEVSLVDPATKKLGPAVGSAILKKPTTSGVSVDIGLYPSATPTLSTETTQPFSLFTTGKQIFISEVGVNLC